MIFRWPLVWRSTYDAVARENFLLRGEMGRITEELHRYRLLVAGIKAERQDVLNVLDRVGFGKDKS